MDKVIKILIVDDHELVRESMTMLFLNDDNYQVLGACKDGVECLDFLSNKDNEVPDVILLDIMMPNMDGFSTLQEIVKRKIPSEVIALTVDNDEASIIKMIRNGAKGYLLKNISINELKSAIKEVNAHGFYTSELIISALNKDVTTLKSKENILQDLTKREMDFVAYACTDLTYKEIAEKLFVSPKTIDTHRDNAFSKLSVKNRIGLILLLVKVGLLDEMLERVES